MCSSQFPLNREKEQTIVNKTPYYDERQVILGWSEKSPETVNQLFHDGYENSSS